MAMTVNGAPFIDGSPFLVGGVQVQTCTAQLGPSGTPVIVWQNGQTFELPQHSTPVDLAAYLASVGADPAIPVTINNRYTQPTINSGDLSAYAGGVTLQNFTEIQGSAPGAHAIVLTSQLKIFNEGWIRGAGGNGGLGGKGLDTTSPGGAQTFTSSGTFTPAAGVTSVNVCMIGGGAGGHASADVGGSGTGVGGLSGIPYSNNVTVGASPVSVVVGPGGAGVYASNNYVPGLPGGQSSFGTAVSLGGGTTGHYGNGNSRSGCWGTSTDGLIGIPGLSAGGQAGFGNGGNAGFDSESGGMPAGIGGVGAGGGGAGDAYNNRAISSAAGGRGEVRVTWGDSTTTGGAGGAGGNGQYYLVAADPTGDPGLPSNPAGGHSGGAGGPGGAWAVAGGTGDTGAGPGDTGGAGQAAGYAIYGAQNIASGSDLGDLMGEVIDS